MQEPQQATDVPAEPAANNFMATLLRATWLAILLGIVMEALPLLFAAGFGSSPGPRLPRRNEILFPVGCALSLFSATAVGKRVSSSLPVAKLLAEPRAARGCSPSWARTR
ncbi:MAG TPA: hypothetical protein VHF70_02245 [Rubrobacteraceae bacterium]|nr:hypothetical protein [Rubrobacteraceae bacterium]